MQQKRGSFASASRVTLILDQNASVPGYDGVQHGMPKQEPASSTALLDCASELDAANLFWFFNIF